MKKLSYLIVFLVIIGCKPENIVVDKVIRNLSISNKTPLADGTTIVYISATLDSLADADKRSVIFETNTGQFLLTTTTTDTLITQAATFQGKSLIANVKLKMPISVSTINITAKPAIPTPHMDYLLKSSFRALESVPNKLTLTPSSFSVKSGYVGEIQLTAVLKNSVNNNVSTGHLCVFKVYLPNGTPLNGAFRALKDTTDATSTVTTFYNPGNLGQGQSFFIKCSYVKPSGEITTIRDSCLITVIP